MKKSEWPNLEQKSQGWGHKMSPLLIGIPRRRFPSSLVADRKAAAAVARKNGIVTFHFWDSNVRPPPTEKEKEIRLLAHIHSQPLSRPHPLQ